MIADELLDELGPALNANGAMFLYGPPGTGKTSIAERVVCISADLVLVPRVVEVDGQIISVYDQTVHIPADEQPDDLDPRWVLCNRPRVVVGGELTGAMLDLTYDQSSGEYLAPLQMKANNGVSFDVPFDVKVVLSTNLDPSDLGDEAFFRRIQTKSFIGSITQDALDPFSRRSGHGCWLQRRVRRVSANDVHSRRR